LIAVGHRRDRLFDGREPSGELIGHLANARGAEKRFDKATDKLFPAG
jgi:hypothetical protein